MRLTDERGRAYIPVSFEDWDAPVEAEPAQKEPPAKAGMTAEDWMGELLLEPEPMPTGTILDNVLGGGLLPGLTVLGAKSNVGKSVLAYEVATRRALAGGRALVVCPDEMPRNVFRHCMCSWTCMGEHNSSAGMVMQNDWAASIAAIRRGLPEGTDLGRYAWESRETAVVTARRFAAAVGDRLVVTDQLGKVSELEEHLEECAETGVLPDVVVLDYLQQLVTGDTDVDRDPVRMLDALTNRLRDLAFRHGIPILAVSMVRNGTCSPGEEPDLQAYRGSGGIAYNAWAGVVIVKAGDKYVDGDVDVWCVKNKAGRTGLSVEGHVYGEYSCVREVAHTLTEPFPDEEGE